MLVNILTCAYNIMIRQSPEAETLMLAKIKDAIFPPSTMYLDFTFQRPSNGNNNKSLFLLFHGLWKMKAEYIILCLNTSAKFRNAKGASYHPALMGNTRLLVTCISQINQVNEFVISQF